MTQRDSQTASSPRSAVVPTVSKPNTVITVSGLRKVQPYWYNYTTMAKGRWLGREILEIVSTEFRDRSMEYYKYALESGVTTINGKVAKTDTVVKNGDRIENIVHRHEPAVTAIPVRVIHHDKEREFIVVDKPGGIPVHAVGRYYHQTLIQILKTEFGFDKLYAVNRIDRPTSGLLIIPLSSTLANTLSQEFVSGQVKKEYVARCTGEFPEGETVCEQPLLTVDRQMGLNIVHPQGKHAKTIFKRLHYDAETDTSVLHCRPLTGRSHQIRVHLQYLGHPIANDPVYSEVRIWGEDLAKGGVDINPSTERIAPVPPSHLEYGDDGNPESSASKKTPILRAVQSEIPDDHEDKHKLLPRETGHDIGMGSPVPLSTQLVEVITKLRNQKDADEDWGRWRDVVFRAKGRLTPKDFQSPPPLPPQNRRKRGGPVSPATPPIEQVTETIDSESVSPALELLQSGVDVAGADGLLDVEVVSDALSGSDTPTEPAPETVSEPPGSPQQSNAEALAQISAYTENVPEVEIETYPGTEETKHCPECYVPVYPDPKPEKLYIFLHALRYTTSLGCYETEMPAWAAKGWQWDRS